MIRTGRPRRSPNEYMSQPEPKSQPSGWLYAIPLLLIAAGTGGLVAGVHFHKISVATALATGGLSLTVTLLVIGILLAKSDMSLCKKLSLALVTLVAAGALVAAAYLWSNLLGNLESLIHHHSWVDLATMGGGTLLLGSSVIALAAIHHERKVSDPTPEEDD